MKASVLVGPQTSKVREVPMPVMGAGDVLVRVEACGVCFSEFHDWLGENKQATYPRTMGHEPSGVIEQVGEAVETLQVGQHVAIMPTRRGPYAGAVGYFGWDGGHDSCIALRTCLLKDGKVYVQAGAGVVADSDPAYEFNETVNKAKGMFRAVGLAGTLGGGDEGCGGSVTP